MSIRTSTIEYQCVVAEDSEPVVKQINIKSLRNNHANESELGVPMTVFRLTNINEHKGDDVTIILYNTSNHVDHAIAIPD